VELIHDQLRYRHLAALQLVKQRHGLATLSGSAIVTGTNWVRFGSCSSFSVRCSVDFHWLTNRSRRSGVGIPAEDPPHVPALGQQHLQHAEPSPDQFGHGQQPQGMAAGRRIHHDAVVLAGLYPRGDFKQRHQLVQTGQREVQKLIDVLIVQEGAGGGNLAQHAAVLLAELGQALLSVQFENL
jgi:hypothetical protein